MTAPALAAPRRRERTWLPYLLIAPPLVIMTLLIFFPALQSVVRTLFIDDGAGGTVFSLQRYADFFNNRVSRDSLWFTLWVTVVTVTIMFVLCFPLALYLRFSTSRLAGWVQTLALFPLFVPGIILAYALIRFFGPRGTVQTVLQLFGLDSGYRSPWLKAEGIILGLIWDNIPLTVLILTAGLRQLDNALLESARDVGANSWQIFRRIILPLMQRPALIVLTLSFLGVFGSYTLPYLLGPAQPQMMAVYMQTTFADYDDTASAETQAVITFLVCAVVGVLYVRAVTRERLGR